MIFIGTAIGARMKKVAIVGGGIGGLSAAYGLVRDPPPGEEIEVTIFQMGWRLGGKCATGRGPNARIEEHGIHGFLGSYYNALAMMQDVYDNWEPNPNCPIPTYNDAFIKISTGLQWERNGGILKRWPRWTPDSPITLAQIRAAPNLLLLWLQVYGEVLRQRLNAVPEAGANLKRNDALTKAFALDALDEFISRGHELLVSDDNWILDAAASDQTDFWSSLNRFIDREVRHSTNSGDSIRRSLLEVEMFQVILRGIRDDQLIRNGFLAIDGENFADWLERHGASVNLLESPLVAHIVNLTFQFPDGDISRQPEMSAASYLLWALRSGTFVERSLYLFAAGTGETIITPLYIYLKSKGVRFKFFQELTDVTVNEAGDTATSLQFQQQAVVKNGSDYDPLQSTKDLMCWPNKPFFDQLDPHADLGKADFEKPGDAAFGPNVTCSVGAHDEADFSHVVLAIPPRALEMAAGTMLRKNEHWRNRLAQMPTTATQAMQLWFKEPIEALADMPAQVANGQAERFYYGSANFPGEMHGELDFSKYLRFEDWGADGPKGLLYGCGVMVDPIARRGLSEREAADLRAFETTRSMLTHMGSDLLPLSVDQSYATVNTHTLDFSDLYVEPIAGQPEPLGQNRLAAHYFRGNVLPSDRYTQSPRGTKAHRINPLKPGMTNLTGAGDWVDTVLNVGSVECTVMGGLFAAAFVIDPARANDVVGAWVTPADSLLAN